MLQNSSENLGHVVGKRLIRVAVAVVGLLLIRLVVSALPMLKNAEPIVLGPTAQEAAALGQKTPDARALQEYSNLIANLAQAKVDPSQYPNLMAHLIFPVSIAKAIVDTLIFIVLVLSALGFRDLILARAKRLPEGGKMLVLATFILVIALAYQSYSGVIPPLLGSESQLYGWFFLVLGVLPLIALIVVASRNLDAITEVVFSSTTRAVTGAPQVRSVDSSIICSKCSNVVAAGAKFCSACGTPAVVEPVVEPVVVKTFCSECGTKNQGGAKFCKNCGKPL